MATLTGNQIDLTYQGLIKLDDNAAIDPTVLKRLSDGTGGQLPISVSQIETKFLSGSIVDLTGTTVVGLSSGGLVSGTGTSSMKSADFLTTSDAIAGGQNTIAIGEGAIANQDYGLTIGTFAQSGIFSTALGTYAEGSGLYCTAVGPSSKANADGAVAVGQATQGLGAGSISIGRASIARLEGQIAIGDDAQCGEFVANAIAIGNNANGGGGTVVGNGSQAFAAGRSAAFGAGAKSLSNESLALGGEAIVNTNSSGAIAIGDQAIVASGAANAVALGNDVTASTPDTVTLKRLQMLDYASLDYADDAAAATGGIPLGGVYHTSGVLKIRIA